MIIHWSAARCPRRKNQGETLGGGDSPPPPPGVYIYYLMQRYVRKITEAQWCGVQHVRWINALVDNSNPVCDYATYSLTFFFPFFNKNGAYWLWALQQWWPAMTSIFHLYSSSYLFHFFLFLFLDFVSHFVFFHVPALFPPLLSMNAPWIAIHTFLFTFLFYFDN